MAGQTLLSAISQTLLPRLSALRLAEDFIGYRRMLARSLVTVTAGGALFSLSAAALGEPLLRLLYGAPYAARMDLFWWLMLGMAVSAPVWLVDAAIAAARCFRVQLPIMAVAVASSAWTACTP